MIVTHSNDQVRLPVFTQDDINIKQTLITLMATAGINVITAENAAEVFARMTMLEALHGPMRHDDEGEILVSAMEVRRFIGLEVNVPTLSLSEFGQRLMQNIKGLMLHYENDLAEYDAANRQTTVDLIASGYEWICPNCKCLNRQLEIIPTVECDRCGKGYTAEAIPAHG